MVVIRSRVLCAGLSVLALAGCASMRVGVAPARHAVITATTNASTAAAPTSDCQGDGAGFAVSRAVEGHGSASPIAAARDFELHDHIPGFGTLTSVWTVTAHAHGEATIVSGRVSLHALQMRDGTWWIDSGKRCD